MHIIKDENGNLCSHTHSHEGEEASCGGHCHGSEAGHCHGSDGHCHGQHEHCQSEAPAGKNAALLKYMYDHNTHHAAELDQMAEKLAAEGQNEAAEQIRRAVDGFQKGNMYLGLALSLVKES